MRVASAKLRSLVFLSGCITAGAAASLWIGQEIWREASDVRVKSYARSLLHHSDEVAQNLTDALAVLNGADGARCSDDDLYRLKRVAFEYRFVKDAGRLSGSTVTCTSMWGVLKKTFIIQGEGWVTKGGTTLWTGVPSYLLPEFQVDIASRNETFVITSPTAFAPFEKPSPELSATITSPDNSRVMRVFGARQVGNGFNERSVSMCSRRFDICVTAFVNNSFFQVDRLGMIVVLGLIGVSFGSLLWYSGSQFVKARMATSTKLRKAIRQGGISVVYQPIVYAESGRVAGFEVLARWLDRDLGWVPPIDFIKLAEEMGMSEALSKSIINQALTQISHLLRTRPDLYVSINLDVNGVLSEQVAGFIYDCCSVNSVETSQVAIEILETSTAEMSLLAKKISEYQRMGFQVFIDDFGAGYSSLSYLTQLKVDKVKIDRSFTQFVGSNPSADFVLLQINNIACSIGVGVIFEGIETEAQRQAILVANRNAMAQGWLYSKAVRIEQLPMLLNKLEGVKL